jgi:NAD(P)-dependent dehydrogenase (short-subunit alcohol dehydrogenase family)
MITFLGQVAVVTGAGRGLGAAHARLLATLGAAVVVHDAGVELDGTGGDPAVADAVVEEIRRSGGVAEPSYEDLTDPRAPERLVDFTIDRFGRLDALIHNAGLLAWSAIEETGDDVWSRIRAVGVDSAFALARSAFPVMKGQGYGRIVLTTSGRAMYVDASLPGLSAYSMAKGAQIGLMIALAAEGEPHGILVNAISPVAATRMLHRDVRGAELLPELVSPGVAFLASSECDVSGVVLRAADGHFSCARWDFSPGIDLGRRPASPDVIADRWPEILGVASTDPARPAPPGRDGG